MKIKLSSVYVDNQEKALKFYTEKLGFIKKTDIPAGEFRWLTVVSPEDQNGTELVLEPDSNPASKEFKRALFDSGIPLTSFEVEDVEKEFMKLRAAGVEFAAEPVDIGTVKVAVLNDTCGNLIQTYQS